MRRIQAIVSMAVVVTITLLTLPVAVRAQGLNDVLLGLLGNNCAALGPGATNGDLSTKLCPGLPISSSGSGAGGTIEIKNLPDHSQKQRRHGERPPKGRTQRAGEPS